MKMTFDINRLVPAFLLSDKNGYALAKAIEKCFQHVVEAAENGLAIIQDPDSMPEWRLDETALELGCFYDYKGTVENKRLWIKNAMPMFSRYGTPQGIIDALEAVFQIVEVEESWQYDGDPFHFRVTISGTEYSPEVIAWTEKTINTVKNVRSVLDLITIDSSTDIVLTADADWFQIPYFLDLEEISSENGLEEWEIMDLENVAVVGESVTDEGVAG